MIKKLWNNERLREIFLYCLVGGLTTVVNYVVYFLFTRLVGGEGSSPGLAALIMDDSFQNVGLIVAGTLVAWLAAVAFAFYPNKRWVFKSKGGNVRRELVQFLSARVLSLVMDVLLMLLFVGACAHERHARQAHRAGGGHRRQLLRQQVLDLQAALKQRRS